jgi:hypothetical protein
MSATPGPGGLIAIDAKWPLGHGAVGEDSVAVAHQHDRPVAAARTGDTRRHAIAKNLVRKGFASDPRRIEPGPQPIADGIDAALVVAAGIDVHEFGQQRDHRLMLPSEMFDDGGLGLDAHGFAPTSVCGTVGGDHRQRRWPTQQPRRCK